MGDGLYLTIRKGVWHYLRRVPSDYAHLDKRDSVKLSTKVKVARDPCGTKARQVAARIDQTVETYWHDLAQRKTVEARQGYSDAVKLARSLGLNYQPAAAVAEKPIGEVLARIETAIAGGRIEHAGMRKAILGGADKPAYRLSGLFAEFKETQRVKLSKKSPNQLKKWEIDYKRPIAALIDLVGDKALHELTREDALAFARYWEDRVITDKLNPNTGNKNISKIGGMVRAVSNRHTLKLDNIFAGTRMARVEDKSRPPFKSEFIRDVILAKGKLDGLNDEARDFVYVMLETGARPSEIVNLTKARIRLDAEIPHIAVGGEDRDTKTKHSKRDIPLVGLALEAMRRHPKGFPRYFDDADSLSEDLMNHFRENGLLPTAEHAVYSFRHSYKDRLKSVEAPEELIDELMGHKIKKPKYGDGYGLALKAKFIQRIAFGSEAKPLEAAA